MNFSQRLEMAMQMRGVTQAVLARRMETSQSTVSRWLTGKQPHSPTVARLAEVLDVRLQWLSIGLEPMEHPMSSSLHEDPPFDRAPDESERLDTELLTLTLSQLIAFARVLSVAKMHTDDLMRLVFRRMEQIEAASAT